MMEQRVRGDGVSEEDLELLVSKLPLPALLCDANQKPLACNRGFSAILGCALADVADLAALLERLHPNPDDRRKADQIWHRAYSGAAKPQPETVSAVLNSADASGAERTLEVWLAPVGDHLLALYCDRSNERQLVDRLERELAFREGVIKYAASGVCVCHNVDDFPFVEFTIWNERMTELTGYTMREINELGWYQTVYPDPELSARAAARMDRMRYGYNLKAEEWPITRADGQIRTVTISTSILVADSGVAHVLGLFDDVTDRKKEAEERRELEHRMMHAQKLESLGVLAGGIAHDFNNLLGAILGFSELALKDLEQGHPAKQWIEKMSEASRHAAELTGQMLAYSGRGQFVVGPIDVNALVTEILSLLQVSIHKKVKLVLDLGDVRPITGDSGQVRQVLLNLVTNASEAIGDRTGTITVSSFCERLEKSRQFEHMTLDAGSYVGLRVRDTGAGMTADDRRLMFEPFFSTKASGRGLGLAAVIGIVRGHKGAIDVETKVGEGTSVTLWLPVPPEATSASTAASSRGVAGQPVGENEREGRDAVSTPRVILVADDEAAVLEVARETLESEGYRVVTATDGESAIELLRTRHNELDLALIDVTMPGMNGVEVAQAARAEGISLPIILMSGYGKVGAAGSATDDLVTTALSKPFALEDLLRAVREALAQRRRRGPPQ